MSKEIIADDEDQYVDDNTNVEVDDDYFDPYADSDDRDFNALMAMSETHSETCDWSDLY